MKAIYGMALLGVTALAAVSMTSSPADAKIRCNGPYQVIKGIGEQATPYCEDNYLAGIARSYGMRVSDKALRNNPHLKEEACLLVGHDTRVQNICAQFDFSNDRYSR